MNISQNHRLYFLDNIRVFLITLVIVHHVGQAYGPTGGFWFYVHSVGEGIPILGTFFSVNAGFFMGFFFLIAGYFIPMSFDKNNGKGFIKAKSLRLGLPLVFGLLVIIPLSSYFHYTLYTANAPLTYWQYFTYIFLGIHGMPEGFIISLVFPELNFGHLWYIEHLFFYSLLYWIIRKLAGSKIISWKKRDLSLLSLFVAALIMSVITVVVRIEYPIDRWEGLLGFFQVEIAHWPQYIIMFLMGIMAYRQNWFFTADKKTGYIAFTVGIVLIVLRYIGYLLGSSWIWDIWPVYESFMCVSVCWGTLIVCREKMNMESAFMKKLARCTYAVYIIHVPVVLALQFAFDKVQIGGVVGKFLMVSLLSIVGSFVVGSFLVKIRGLNKIL